MKPNIWPVAQPLLAMALELAELLTTLMSRVYRNALRVIPALSLVETFQTLAESRGSFGVSNHRDMSRWFEKIP